MKKNQKQRTDTGKGFTRYVFGERYILKSDSFEDSIKKIKEDKKKYEKDTFLYYNEKTLWLEFQFLFMIQFVEHNTAEFIFDLAEKKKIEADKYFQKFKKERTKLDGERKGTNREFSPNVLLVVLGYSLGRLLEIVRDCTKNFEGKNKIVEKLGTFNERRISFIHKSFSHSTDITGVLDEGIKFGCEILSLYSLYSSLGHDDK